MQVSENEDALLTSLADLPSPVGVVLMYDLGDQGCLFVDNRLIHSTRGTLFFVCTSRIFQLIVFKDNVHALEALRLSAGSRVHVGPKTLVGFVCVPVYRSVLLSWADFSMLGINPSDGDDSRARMKAVTTWAASVPEVLARAYRAFVWDYISPEDACVAGTGGQFDMEYQHTVLLGRADYNGYVRLD